MNGLYIGLRMTGNLLLRFRISLGVWQTEKQQSKRCKNAEIIMSEWLETARKLGEKSHSLKAA